MFFHITIFTNQLGDYMHSFFSCLVFFFEDWCDQDVLTTHIYIGAMNIPMLLVDCMLQPSGSQMLL